MIPEKDRKICLISALILVTMYFCYGNYNQTKIKIAQTAVESEKTALEKERINLEREKDKNNTELLSKTIDKLGQYNPQLPIILKNKEECELALLEELDEKVSYQGKEYSKAVLIKSNDKRVVAILEDIKKMD